MKGRAGLRASAARRTDANPAMEWCLFRASPPEDPVSNQAVTGYVHTGREGRAPRPFTVPPCPSRPRRACYHGLLLRPSREDRALRGSACCRVLGTEAWPPLDL